MNEINFSAAKVNNSNLESLILGDYQSIRKLLETLYIGKNAIELDVVDSTNNYASGLITDFNVIEGTTVIAHYQDSGKGQRGNVWYSEPGKNLTFSIVLKPTFLEIKDAFLISKVISLAICNYLETIVKEQVFIKWPNDIYVGGKKICGILIENQFKKAQIEYAIIGIGLNVNQTHFENVSFATSLSLVAQKEFSLEAVFHEVLKNIEYYYQELRTGNITNLEHAYLNNLLFMDEIRKYRTKNGVIIGRITNVLSDGKLELRTEKKECLYFDMKEIKFVF